MIGPAQLAVLRLLLVVAIAVAAGCQSQRFLHKRTWRENPLEQTLNLVGRGGPTISPRTGEVLNRYGLDERYQLRPEEVLANLQQRSDGEYASLDPLFATAELAYVAGKRAEEDSPPDALAHYRTTLMATYTYLLSPAFEGKRNVYDPQFRAVCDLYNEALEDTLRILCAEIKKQSRPTDPAAAAEPQELRPGLTYTVDTGDQTLRFITRSRGEWRAEDFQRFEFVSDYRVTGLNNRHQTFGLGVPLVAIRTQSRSTSGPEQYHPDNLSFAVTALLRCDEVDAEGDPVCVLEFFDPREQHHVDIEGRKVPLETDLTTPLAYFLENPRAPGRRLATLGLLNPIRVEDDRGFYMLEPYDPDRIPVVMVHGLWSSPLTWMDMFNDLRSFPEIRENYQFWFYLYPTGQPFWISAAQMRRDLREMRTVLDPNDHSFKLHQTVLVGHSMGGLVSRLQTIDSEDQFWRIISDQPISRLQAEPEDRVKLTSTLVFQPDPSIRRVITIGTPHRGSEFANETTRWLAQKLITLPQMVMATGSRLVSQNPDFFKNTALLTTTTSIDSLAPDSPIFPVMLRAKKSPQVKYHNIAGQLSKGTLLSRFSESGDGVVSLASARLEPDDRESELIVDADHTEIHARPETIFEVRRILLEHLDAVHDEWRIALQRRASGIQQATGLLDSEEPVAPAKAGHGGILVPFSDN